MLCGHRHVVNGASSFPKSNLSMSWKDTRLLIIDEISFACKSDFVKIHKNLRRLTLQLHLPYGGMNVIFSGDMRQLKLVKKEPIYNEVCPEFKDWVNCFIELEGMHRFRDDPEWGEVLLRFRNGEVTVEDIEWINNTSYRHQVCNLLQQRLRCYQHSSV